MSTTIQSSSVFARNTYVWNGTANASSSSWLSDGFEVFTNEVPNPGFNTGTTGWSTFSSASIAWLTSGMGDVTITSALVSGSAFVTYANLPAVEGDVKSFAIEVSNAGTSAVTVAAMMKNNGGTAAYPSGDAVTIASGARVRLTVENVTMPAGTTSYSVFVKAQDATLAAGSRLLLDNAVANTGSTVSDYFDGNTPGYDEYRYTSPLLVDGWTEAVESRNIINPIVGGDVDVTLASAAKRTGSFVLLYGSEGDAKAAFDLHTLPATFHLTDSERPTVDLTYVLSGALERALDEESRVLWVVTVNYQEV